jgi:hypothetical protein
MAQKVCVILIDDIDGSEAVETVQFGLDGAHYEIDLNHQHGEELRAAVTPYTEKARKATARAGRPGQPHRAAADARNKAIRQWARERGFTINERGRVPADIIAKYEAENSR